MTFGTTRLPYSAMRKNSKLQFSQIPQCRFSEGKESVLNARIDTESRRIPRIAKTSCRILHIIKIKPKKRHPLYAEVSKKD